MSQLVERLLGWWKNASPRMRWGAGIFLFSLCAPIALMVLTGSQSGGFSGTPASGSSGSAGADVMDPTPWYLFDVAFKLILVIGLVVGYSVIYRHFAGRQSFGRAVRRLEMVETLRLGPRQALHLVRAGNRMLLIGSSDQTLSLISEVEAGVPFPVTDQETEKVSSSGQQVNFQSVLSSLVAKQHSPR